MNKDNKFYIEMGRDATRVLMSYYSDSLVKFIKNEPLADGESSGSMYLGEIKKYYDKYGYENFNTALVYLYGKKEDKDNE